MGACGWTVSVVARQQRTISAEKALLAFLSNLNRYFLGLQGVLNSYEDIGTQVRATRHQ